MDIFAKFENWLAVEAHALMQNSEGDESVAFLGDCNVARIRFHVSLSMQSIEGLRLLTLSVSKFYVEPAFRLQGKFTKFLKFIELQAFKY